MFKRLYMVLMLGVLCGQLITAGCVSTTTIKQPAYEPFLRSKPIEDNALNDIKTRSPKDAVFADLLQAFALMRSGNLTHAPVKKEILGLLETSVASFEDMNDPVNFSAAFTADENKPFRGWPHERMFASTMAGIFHMAENRCDQALPYLKNAEFLDARFQKMPFGTDAPLIYALMYRCLLTKKASANEVNHAASGVFRSVRFLTMQEPLVDALVDLAAVDMRSLAIAHRIAYMIFEISIYHSLMTVSDFANVDAVIDDATRHVSLFIAALSENFDDEYKARMKPLIKELAQVYGMNSKTGLESLEELALQRVALEAKSIGDKLKLVFSRHAPYKERAHKAGLKTKELTEKILSAARAEKMVLSFLGRGPSVIREGSYQEVAVIKPGPDASLALPIRERSLKVDSTCGFHRVGHDGEFSVVLCGKNQAMNEGKIEELPSLELLSLSRKATSAQGRKFDKVLKGRAQFRAATEKIAEISAWSAFYLFYLGSAMMTDCQRRNESQACYAKGLTLWTLAGITVIFSGTIWLIGRSKNPSADSRYIHLMYESVFLSMGHEI